MSRLIDSIGRFIISSPHHLWLLSLALWMSGMVWLSMFHQLDRPTEIEEHSLLPGLASFGLDNLTMYEQSLRRYSNNEDDENGIYGVKTYQFTNSSIPFSMITSKRGDGREAVVVVVTGDARHAEALGSTLTRFFTTVEWLSKDVIILFSTNLRPASYASGVRKWLREYSSTQGWDHPDDSNDDDYDIPSIGIIRQCIVVNVTLERGDGVLIEVDGINGMQPNQDWPNAYIIEARRSGISHIQVVDVWESVMKQARNGNVHSLHSPFLSQQIPAFTVTTFAATNMWNMAKSIEGIVHSSSSMLQQLHHSFNVYFYNTPITHVSNGIFLYPVIAIIAPLIVRAFPIRKRSLPSFLTSITLALSFNLIVGSPLFLLLINSVKDSQCRGDQLDDDSNHYHVWYYGLALSLGMIVLMSMIYRHVQYNDKDTFISISSATSLVYLTMLLPLILINWSLAVPTVLLVVPLIAFSRPCHIRHIITVIILILSSITLLRYYSIHTVLDEVRVWYHETLLPLLSLRTQKYMPTKLIDFLATSSSFDHISSAEMLYTAAKDWVCVRGLLLPVICYIWLPAIAYWGMITFGMRVKESDNDNDVVEGRKGLTHYALRDVIILFIVIIIMGIGGGILWRSTSSAGLGDFNI